MAVKELEREVAVAEPQKKTKEPPRYQAVYSQGASFLCQCHVGVLSGVFNLSTGDAIMHIVHAIANGRSSVLAGPKDLIETKVGVGNERLRKESNCTVRSGAIFKCEIV